MDMSLDSLGPARPLASQGVRRAEDAARLDTLDEVVDEPKARLAATIGLVHSNVSYARADRRSNIEEKKMLYDLKRGTDGEEQARLDLIAALEAPRPAGPVRAETPEPQVPKAPAKTRPSPPSFLDICSDDEAAPAEE